MSAAVPGASEAEVAGALAAEVVGHGGALYDVVLSAGARAHTLAPSGGAAGTAGYTTRRLAAGELLRIDAYGSLGGYLFDFARSRVVGPPPNRSQRDLLDAVRESVRAGIAALRPGVKLGAVADRCEAAPRFLVLHPPARNARLRPGRGLGPRPRAGLRASLD